MYYIVIHIVKDRLSSRLQVTENSRRISQNKRCKKLNVNFSLFKIISYNILGKWVSVAKFPFLNHVSMDM